MKMTKDKILKAIGSDSWDKIKKLAFGDAPAGEFTEATLADGTTISYSGELAEGTAVMVISQEGEAPIPDGEYEMEDGATFTTKKGVVETFTPAEEAPEGEEKSPKNPADLKQKIEVMRRQHAQNKKELVAIKKQFNAIQADNKALKTNLSKISKVLEILVENTPNEAVRNRQFSRNAPNPSKADRIAALLKN